MSDNYYWGFICGRKSGWFFACGVMAAVIIIATIVEGIHP